jgi:hypothetical protein
MRHLSDALGWAQVSVTWRSIMPRTDLLELSATRVEVDQRSREARLRLEHVERSLVVHPLPRQSLLRRVLRCLGFRIFTGRQVGSRSAKAILTGGRLRQRRKAPAEAGGAADSMYAAPLVSQLGCPKRARIPVGPARPGAGFRVRGRPAGDVQSGRRRPEAKPRLRICCRLPLRSSTSKSRRRTPGPHPGRHHF